MVDAKQTNESSFPSEILNSAAFSDRWREDFLKIVLRAAVILGGILLAYALFHGDLLILAIYAVIFVTLLAITFAPISYSIRAGVFAGLIYLVGATIVLGYGVSADAATFLLAFMAITALLFDYRMGLGALALSAVTLIIIGVLVFTGQFRLLAITNKNPLTDWITYGLDMSVPGAVIILAIYFLKREFNTVLRQVREIFQALQIERTQLEERVERRTAELVTANEKTAEQASRLRAIAEVSRSAAEVLEQDRLMNLLTNLISRQLNYYHVGIFLLDARREYALLTAANSEGGAKMLARGHRLQVGKQSMVGYVTSTGKPRIALNVGADAVYFNNPDMPGTHSEMCLPLKVKDVVVGALDIQSTETNAFTEDDYSVLSILADQVAIAIQNAKANEETQRALREAGIASSQLTGRAWKDYLNKGEVKGYHFRGTKAEPIKGVLENTNSDEPMNIPIRLRGQTIGNLRLTRTSESHIWTDDELAMVQATADRVALALESARLLEDSLKRANKERVISEVSARIGASANIDSIVRMAAQELGKIMTGSDITIQVETPKIGADE